MKEEKKEEKTTPVPTTFRVTQEAADAFRSFCAANGMNQAQGLDHMLQIVELNQAKNVAPGRSVEIENFERLVKGIMEAYLNSLELCDTSEARVLEQFKSEMQRRDHTIDDLQKKLEAGTDKIKTLQESMDALTSERDLAAEKNARLSEMAEAARKSENEQAQTNTLLRNQVLELQDRLAKQENYEVRCQTLEETCKEKEYQIRTLKDKMEASENENAGLHEEISACTQKINALEDQIVEFRIQAADLARQVQDKTSDSENALKQARMQADLDMAQAVMKKEREMQEEIRALDRKNAQLSMELEHLKGAAGAGIKAETGSKTGESESERKV